VRSADLAGASRRIAVVRVLLVAGFVALGARASDLTVNDPRARQLGGRQLATELRIPPSRGEIQDRDGRGLAVSVDAPSVYVVPPEIADREATARALARALDRKVSYVRGRMDRPSRFVFVARWVSEATKERVLALGLPGVGVVPEPRRVHPLGPRAGALVGFVDIDGEGVRGVERQEDAWLRGAGVAYPVERDARGRKLVSPGVDPRATVGGDVRLTIDAALQASAEAALARAVDAHEAAGGVVVSLDPRTGDLLAVAQHPPFDPNAFRRTPFAETRARAFTDAVEPGSVMKAFLMAGALARGVVDLDESIACENGAYRVPGKTIHDHEPHDRLDPAGILRVSSNIGATKLAYRLGAERHHALLRAFGFGERTGSGFPGESAGLLRSWERWRPVDHANIAFGQGLNVTAVQLAAAMGVLAHGGVWQSPRLVAARKAPGGAWMPARPGAMRRVVDAETAATVLSLLEGVVADAGGTAWRAGLRGVRVAGKTGTAQKLDRETGRYHDDRYVAWFAGVVPADEPQIVVVAAVDDPRGDRRGGSAVAAPLFARVASDQLAHLGIFTRPEPVRHLAASPGDVKTVAEGGTLSAEPGDAPPRPGVRGEEG